MKTFQITAVLALGLMAAAPAGAVIGLEAGYSHFKFRDSDPERDIGTRMVDEPSRGAPFIAGSMTLTERIGLRLSYHYIDDIRSTAELRLPEDWPATVSVHGAYRDNVHLVTFAPEYGWSPRPGLLLAISPQLHWVNSRGHVSYSTNWPDLVLPDPERRNRHGFTLGISGRIGVTLSERSAAFVGYGFSDLEPSFGRQAHVFSGGFSFAF
jgi:hypothetical protein